MADNIKISQLDALTAAQNSTVVPVVDGGTTKKMSLSTLQTHLTASFATPTQLSTQISSVNSTISGLTTDDISEGTNKYYTNARVEEYLGDIGAITSSAGVDALYIENLSPAVEAILNANDVVSGSLTSTDITDFDTAVSTSAAAAGFGTGGGGSSIPSGTVSSSAQITNLGFISESISASYALTASYALNAAGGAGNDYISNINLNNSILEFTGSGNAFNGTLNLAVGGGDGGNLLTTDDAGNFVGLSTYETDSSSFASRIDSSGGSADWNTLNNKPNGIVSSSTQIVVSNADLTGLTIDDIGNGVTNKYYADSLVLTYINSLEVVSGSTAGGGTWPVSGTPPDIVSSSNQIELLGFVTNNIFGSATESLQAQINTISGSSGAASLNNENTFLAAQTFTQGIIVTGSVLMTGGSFSGSGAQLFGIPATSIVGGLQLSGSSLADGTNAFAVDYGTGMTATINTGSFFVNGGDLIISGGAFSGSGAGLTDIPGSAIVGGVGGGTSIATGSVTASVDPTLGLIVNSDISASGDVYARSISVGTSGTPTIYSSNNLNLSASNAVVITDSPLRLTPFSNATTASFTFSEGDLVYSSDSDDFYGYRVIDGTGSLVSLTTGVTPSVNWGQIVGIPNDLVSSSAQLGDLGVITSSAQLIPDAGTGDVMFTNALGVITSSVSFRYIEGTGTLNVPSMSVTTLSYSNLSGPAAATGSFNLVDADRVLINGVVELPTSDGTTNQIIKTNGSGITSFGNLAWGEITSLPSGILSSSNQLVELDAALEGQANTFTADQFISGTLYVTESVFADILNLPAKDPLPTTLNSGSIAVSGSGAQMKPYFWNGIAWQAMI